jgi:glutathione S-transferase
MDKLELYYLPTCPYCQKVLRFMDEIDLKVPLKDINVPANRDTLIKVGGSHQVPCLFIDGVPMYESNDIIEFLREKYCH